MSLHFELNSNGELQMYRNGHREGQARWPTEMELLMLERIEELEKELDDEQGT